MNTSLQDFRFSASDLAAVENPHPPSSNTGGIDLCPPTLGPKKPHSGAKTVIDYLSFTTETDLDCVVAMLAEFTIDMHIVVKKAGMFGYPFSANIERLGESVGVIGWGAEHGRNFVSFSGAGCKHWTDAHLELVVAMLRECEARLTRVDIAFDVYAGEVTYEDAEAALEAGEFRTTWHGVNPAVERHASIGNYGNKGRTLYVGSSKSSKRICIYEKGLEQFGKLPAEWLDKQTPESVVSRRLDDTFGIAGDATVADWLRLEVRYSNKDFDLDAGAYRIIAARDEFFAGAYPFCAKVLGRCDGVRPPSLLTETECTLELMKLHAKNAYGGLVFGLKQSGYSDTEVVNALNAGGHSKRLIKAGIFTHLKTVIPF